MTRTLVATGTTSGGSTTTGILAGLLDYFPSDDDANGCVCYATAASEWRRMTDWDTTAFTFTVNRAFSATLAAKGVEIYKGFTPSEIDDAAEQAITEVYPYLSALIRDITTTVVGSTYTYAIPATILDLNRMFGGKVEVQTLTSGTGEPFTEIPRWDAFRTRTAAGVEAYTLQLYDLSGLVGRVLRITGKGLLTAPATDAAFHYLNADGLHLLALKTCEVLWRNSVEADNRDIQGAQAKAQEYAALYEKAKDVLGDMLEPSRTNDLSFNGFGTLALAQNSTPTP